jgi:O-methyltransferase
MTYPDLSALVDFPGWREARDVVARGPAEDAAGLRAAYLDLLKLALCDLVGTSTISVGKWPDGSLTSRVLAGENRRLRSAGMDWPQQGLTMVGLNRLDDLQRCVETVVADGVEGDLIEAGTWRGGASMLMRATLDSLGARDRTVHLADSFQGFPVADRQGHLNRTSFLAIAEEEVRDSFARLGLADGLRFLPGFFEETLPGLAGHPWAVVRLDGDTYEATWLALDVLYRDLAVGGYLIVDDFHAMPECGRAVEAFRAHHGIEEPLEKVDWTCMRWRRESAAPLRDAAERPAFPPERTEPMDRSAPEAVLTEREVELTREVEALRARVAELESAGPLAALTRRARSRQ